MSSSMLGSRLGIGELLCEQSLRSRKSAFLDGPRGMPGKPIAFGSGFEEVPVAPMNAEHFAEEPYLCLAKLDLDVALGIAHAANELEVRRQEVLLGFSVADGDANGTDALGYVSLALGELPDLRCEWRVLVSEEIAHLPHYQKEALKVVARPFLRELLGNQFYEIGSLVEQLYDEGFIFRC